MCGFIYVYRYVSKYAVAMYICIYILIQTGMQPIHSAAGNGCIDVISILVEKFGVDPQEKADVCTHT